MWKKYLLSIADFAGTGGFITGLILSVALGSILILFGFKEIGVGVMCTLFLCAVVFAIVTNIQRHKKITHVDDFKELLESNIWDSPYLLKVVDGVVVDYGRYLWGKENIFFVVVPYLFDWTNRSFNVSTSLSHKVGSITVSIGVTLTIYLVKSDGSGWSENLYGFVPQELYDIVVKGGFQSVEGWILASFKKVVQEAPKVQEVFETYSKGEAYVLVEALQHVLPLVDFKKSLSNIEKIEIRLVADKMSFITTVTY